MITTSRSSRKSIESLRVRPSGAAFDSPAPPAPPPAPCLASLPSASDAADAAAARPLEREPLTVRPVVTLLRRARIFFFASLTGGLYSARRRCSMMSQKSAVPNMRRRRSRRQLRMGRFSLISALISTASVTMAHSVTKMTTRPMASSAVFACDVRSVRWMKTSRPRNMMRYRVESMAVATTLSDLDLYGRRRSCSDTAPKAISTPTTICSCTVVKKMITPFMSSLKNITTSSYHQYSRR
mmetsp:Transcript_15932/g.55485  ORF Transcript_15932/g.55485 Transcript_15932/m.55485 type:complete len:240 (-) Transcript_15932:17410-18129(-)